jgi:UDPglucose--hexose-1-phosphate uridylyltransferase
MSFDPAEHPHRRYNPLRDEWILVSPHRAKRPWQGQEDTPDVAERPSHDPDCYLCPGNQRISGETNPDYSGTYVFANDFAALLADTPAPETSNSLLRAEAARGTARVMCFSPDHSRSLAEFNAAEIQAVIDVWCEQSAELGQHYAHVQLFETKGELLGSSNPHPHGQIWASDYLPQEIATEERTQIRWLAEHGMPMLLQLAETESGGPRVVFENADWLVIVPWWADWPFETLLLPKFAVRRMPDLTGAQRNSLSEVIRELMARYDNLFQCSFPYLMGWHGAPFTDAAHDHWQLHAHYYPPLLRSASVRKFKAGYEALAEAQRDLTAEQAAEMLRSVSPIHFREGA